MAQKAEKELEETKEQLTTTQAELAAVEAKNAELTLAVEAGETRVSELLVEKTEVEKTVVTLTEKNTTLTTTITKHEETLQVNTTQIQMLLVQVEEGGQKQAELQNQIATKDAET